MNLPRTLFVIATMAWSSASAALYTLNNGSGASATGIQTMAGSTFRSGTTAGTPFAAGGGVSAGGGVVAFGTFDNENFSGITSASQLLALFDQFGGTVDFNVAGPTGARSIFSSAQIETVAGSTLSGDEIFVVIGNGSTVVTSTAVMVLKTNFIFDEAQDNNPLPNVLSINTTNTQPVFQGLVVSNVQTTDNDLSTTPGWMIWVPEPSSTLLGLLGAASLLRRRR